MAKQFGAKRRVTRDMRNLIRDLVAELNLHLVPLPPCAIKTVCRAMTWLSNTEDAEG